MAFTERFDDFQQEGCEVLAISCKDQAAHVSWLRIPREEGGLGETKIQFICDLDGKICAQFGTLRQLEEETWESRKKKL